MCPFCLPFYPLSRWTFLLPRLKHPFGTDPGLFFLPPGLHAAIGIAPGLSSLLPVPAAVCPPPHAVTACCAAKPELPTGGNLSQQSKSEQTVPPGSRQKNQAIKKAPAVRRMPCFVSWEFLLTCGFIPDSGGFPECSAQHRTVRRRATAKSAAEEAAHRRSKWRCPDQGEMPSVRWQWLCGAGH